MNVIELLKKNAEKAPYKVALIHKGDKISYGELEAYSTNVAKFFTQNQVYAGQKALLFVPLSINLYIIILGLMRMGVSVVLIDPSAGRGHIEKCIKSVKPDIFIGTPKSHLLRFIAAIGAIPKKFLAYCEVVSPSAQIEQASQTGQINQINKASRISKANQTWWARQIRQIEQWILGKAVCYTNNDEVHDKNIHENQKTYKDFDALADHSALITFTSGSTGIPKGISRSHGFLITQNEVLARSLPPTENDIEFNTLPVFILSNLANRITSVIPDIDVKKPATVDAKIIIQQMQKDGVNCLLAAPAFCKNIADYLESQKQVLHGIQRVCTGGGPVFPNLLKQLSLVFPNATIIALYGSTEAEPIAHISMHKIDEDSFIKMQQGNGLLTGEPILDINLAIIPDKDGQAIGPFTDKEFNDFSLYISPKTGQERSQEIEDINVKAQEINQKTEQYINSKTQDPVQKTGRDIDQNSGQKRKQGEIVVAGEHVQKSYISGDDGKTKFKVGDIIWHRTGDAGYVDEKGKLWLLGRCSAKIVRKDKVIYPFCMEATAMSFLGVEKAAFVDMDGITVLAIESKLENTKALCEKIQNNLRDVDFVRVVKKIPLDKRHNSKVLYAELKSLLSLLR